LPPFASLNLGLHVGDDRAAVVENRRRLAAATGLPLGWATARQVHGTTVLTATDLTDEPADLGTGDALITDRPGLPLAIFTADCVAVYLYDPVRRAIGLAHAGWRGTVADIGPRTLKAMAEAYGTRPDDVSAAVAPSIGPCCYEVDEPVMAAVRRYPWAEEVSKPTTPGHWRLDLWRLNQLQLIAAGVRPDNINVSGLCTACDPRLFFSYRAEAGRTGRQVALLMLT
jgi:YfiH family protein